MEEILAERILVGRGVLHDDDCRARLDAMLPHVSGPPIEIVDDDELEAELTGLGERTGRPRRGTAGASRRKRLVAFARLRGTQVFPGYRVTELRNGRRERVRGVMCQTAIEIQSAVGCAFDCAYCPYGEFLCVRLDVTAFADRVAGLAAARSCQLVYKLNNRTDTLALEPEYGLAAALVERFARLDGRYLMLYSKGDAVDHLTSLDHGGRTIACFTLTPEPVAALLEHGAPPPAARIAAMAALYRAGYPVRARFSPVVPIDGWQSAYADLVAQVAAVCRPEMITLWTLSMIEAADLGAVVPLDRLDAEAWHAALTHARAMRGQKGAPFPPALRIAIYADLIEIIRAHLPDTLVSLCLEPVEVWQALAPRLDSWRGGRFLCNCGPRVTPAAISAAGRSRR